MAAPFLLRRRRTRRVSPRGYAPWSQGAFLGRTRWRHLLILASCAEWRVRQREGRQGGAPCGADELGDAGKPVLVEVVDGAVVQELSCQEQHSMRIHGGATGWDNEPARVSDRVAVRPSRRTEGCWEEACCSFPTGPVAALAAGDGERRGRPPTGAFWVTQVARAARRSARARRASAMDTTEDRTRTAEERFQCTPTWRAKCRISGSGRPLRFERWGARGDLSPTDLRPIFSCELR